MTDAVHIEHRGETTIVTLNRPERRNAVDPATGVELRQAFEAFDADADVKVAILTGAQGMFCAGADLKALSGSAARYEGDGPGPMGPTRMLLSKPVIAAIEGHAVAGGLELALWADLRVAAQGAVFGVFCRRWGVPLVDGGTVRLPRLIGHSRALDLILTGRPVGADEALAIGLANRVVPDGQALAAAIALAEEIARFPQDCLRIDRASTYQQWGQPLSEALLHEGVAADQTIIAAARAGAARFAEGRGRGGDFGNI
ncbi:crotonase/enoyl-CoA hydratase family protein [uncultured Brevundimonas sp.]|uniref:crotonase/enoyl-CoA hydratase family protein n=1 Tax=uncultured Brevundimonas sp. TaxID=213418 RepID=UPI0030ED38A0|tara:strand:+ start:2756 stop:3526 length:771 start_codon:yes stop_codon:yes gene_type:complete